jgi:hypothetical protein
MDSPRVNAVISEKKNEGASFESRRKKHGTNKHKQGGAIRLQIIIETFQTPLGRKLPLGGKFCMKAPEYLRCTSKLND